MAPFASLAKPRWSQASMLIRGANTVPELSLKPLVRFASEGNWDSFALRVGMYKLADRLRPIRKPLGDVSLSDFHCPRPQGVMAD